MVANPLNEAGAFSLTSDALAPDRFPLFAGERSGRYVGAAGVNPLGPVEGRRYAGALHADSSYQRLGRTIDLTDVTAAAGADPLDVAVVQHHGDIPQRDRRSGAVGHRRLDHPARHARRHHKGPAVALLGGPADHASVPAPLPDAKSPVRSTGTTGEWNAFSGESGGWRNVSFDLSRYAGRPVDVKVSYVANTIVGAKNGIGVFVDDTRVTTTAGVLDADGFESDTSPWTVEGPPPGSPPADGSRFAIGPELIAVAPSVSTADTVLLGYGLEALATPEERADVLGRALAHVQRRHAPATRRYPPFERWRRAATAGSVARDDRCRNAHRRGALPRHRSRAGPSRRTPTSPRR